MSKKDTYADRHLRKVDEYVSDVLSGKILSNQYVKQAVERYVRDRQRDDLDFNKERVAHVFKFFALLRTLIGGEYAQFELMPFQCFIIANIYGFYWKSSGRRRFRYSYLEMSRKSGKTMFSVGLSLYHLVADGEKDAQVLFLASTREQAGIALRYSKSIIANSPALQSRVNVLQYHLRFIHTSNGTRSDSILKTLASNADRLDGYSPSYVLIDEYHAHPTDDILKVMKSGVLARNNPLINIITTAGFDLSKPCYEYREGAINLLRGETTDDSLFAIIFTLDEGDDFTDSDLWEKSNPALGVISNIDDLKTEFNQAVITPSLLNNFLTKNLNIWVTNQRGWIEEKVLTEVFSDDIKLDDFKGQDCYIGLDLSSTRDLTSAVLLFESGGHFYSFPFFFMANNPAKKIRKGGINLGTWIRQGHIIECKTKTVDYDLLYDYFERWANDFNVVAVGYDYLNSALIVPKIETLGISCIKMPQTPMAFNFPLKFLEKLMYDGSITLTNPALKWNFRNVVLYTDGNDNIKIMKNKSLDSVDGCVSLGEALAMWLQVNYDPERIAMDAYIKRERATSGSS